MLAISTPRYCISKFKSRTVCEYCAHRRAAQGAFRAGFSVCKILLFASNIVYTCSNSEFLETTTTPPTDPTCQNQTLLRWIYRPQAQQTTLFFLRVDPLPGRMIAFCNSDSEHRCFQSVFRIIFTYRVTIKAKLQQTKMSSISRCSCKKQFHCRGSDGFTDPPRSTSTQGVSNS